MNLEASIAAMAKSAREASRQLARLPRARFDEALTAIGSRLEEMRPAIQAANRKDLEAGQSRGLTKALLQRLELNDKVFASMIAGLRQVIELPNPLGQTISEWDRPNGLHIRKVRVPIGVIGIIYESRPNVTVDASALCLKTGNAVILRGGSEAIHSNLALAEAIRAGLAQCGLPEGTLQLVETTDREAITALCRQSEFIDLLIPRGGIGLIKTVNEQARMPVIKHFHGICHVYVHAEADLEMAESIAVNAKCQKPGVCNAMETLLIDEAIAPVFVPRIVRALQARGVEIRGDAATQKLAGATILAATEADWTEEYLDLILSVRVVPGIEAAIAHMDLYGSHHSDAIVTKNPAVAERFLTELDSATVYWNASTRFTDGFEFGFGAEIGISTDKIHARGPMGLEELTSYKYQITGDGQTRQ